MTSKIQKGAAFCWLSSAELLDMVQVRGAKTGKNGQKQAKTGKNRQKQAKTGNNCPKLPKMAKNGQK